MNIILFENNVENLYPITLTRPAFDIMCGGTTLYRVLKAEFPQASFEFSVRDYIQAYTDNKFGAVLNQGENAGKTLFIDSSIVPDIETIKKLGEMVRKEQSFKVKVKDNNLVTYLSDITQAKDFDKKNLDQFIDELNLEAITLECKTFEKISDVIVINKEILNSNLEYLKQGLQELKPGVFIGEGAKIADQVVINVNDGPVVINDDVEIDPFVSLRGPLYIGNDTYIKSFADIRHSVIGSVCKAGGEIQNAIISDYSNKAHQGFIGSSYIGSWVNLGGGTSNSDLKNTYGTIKMAGADTGQQFLGCVVGDYTKTSIGTLIYTGKIIGVSSFLYDDVKTDIPSFTNLLEDDKLIECPIDIAQRVQKAVRDRREVETTELDKKLLEDVYNLTKDYRKKFKVKHGKLK